MEKGKITANVSMQWPPIRNSPHQCTFDYLQRKQFMHDQNQFKMKTRTQNTVNIYFEAFMGQNNIFIQI